MSTAHRVPTTSSVPSPAAAAARSDGRRMAGSVRGRAHAEHRHTESSSARRRRAAIVMASEGKAESGIGELVRKGGFGWVPGKSKTNVSFYRAP